MQNQWSMECFKFTSYGVRDEAVTKEKLFHHGNICGPKYGNCLRGRVGEGFSRLPCMPEIYLVFVCWHRIENDIKPLRSRKAFWWERGGEVFVHFEPIQELAILLLLLLHFAVFALLAPFLHCNATMRCNVDEERWPALDWTIHNLQSSRRLLYFSKHGQLDLFKASDSISDYLTSIFPKNFWICWIFLCWSHGIPQDLYAS